MLNINVKYKLEYTVQLQYFQCLKEVFLQNLTMYFLIHPFLNTDQSFLLCRKSSTKA